MKELSIIEKAKAYDNAKYIMKEYLESGNAGVIAENTIKKAFPELAESEDERIRKELIEFVKSRGGFKQEYIAWLEKQGEQKSVISNDALREGIAHFGITQYQIDNWLKKYADVEKQDEQKPTDKAEPKFKVGNWIIYKDNIWKICNISLGIYYELLKINNEVSIRHFEGVDKTAHLWTIQDAKDGDVLVLNNEVFIYAHRKQMYSIAAAHCFVDSAGSFHLDGEFGYKEWGKTISPATKEQRDLLFQKMKEAGYDWDSHTNKMIYNNDYRRLC